MFSGPFVRPLTAISRDAIYLCTQWTDFNETWDEYLSCEWALLKRLSRSKSRSLPRRINL